jgi:hypothetical protein
MRNIKRRKNKYPIFEKPDKKTGCQKVWISKNKYVVICYNEKAILVNVIGIGEENPELGIHPTSYNSTFITFPERHSVYW